MRVVKKFALAEYCQALVQVPGQVLSSYVPGLPYFADEEIDICCISTNLSQSRVQLSSRLKPVHHPEEGEGSKVEETHLEYLFIL